MAMVRVKVRKDHTYGGKIRRFGDEYEVDERFLVLLEGLGRVIRAVDIPVTSPQETPPKGAYRRRDLRADK